MASAVLFERHPFGGCGRGDAPRRRTYSDSRNRHLGQKIACHFIRRAQMLPVLDREVVEADGRRDT